MQPMHAVRDADGGRLMHAVSVSARSTDEAAKTIELYFPGTKIGAGRGEEFRCDFDTFVSPSGVTFLDYTIAGRPTQGYIESSVGYAFTVARMEGEMTLGRDVVDADRPFLIPEGLRGTYNHTCAQAVMIDQRTLIDYLGRIPGRTVGGPFRFTALAPHSEAHDRLWRSTLHAVASAMQSDLGDDPLFARTLADLVAVTVLRCFPNNWQDAHHRSHPTTAALRRAVAYIDEHAHEPMTVSDIAAAGGMSVRSLQEAFRSQLDTTPVTYLRSVRLARAREQLRGADPVGGSVETVARAAGFVHMPRFAAAYRDAYGESPRETLRSVQG